MPKMKTRRSAAKRFKATATGEFKRAKAFRSHILEHKSPTRKRNLRKAALVHKTDHEREADAALRIRLVLRTKEDMEMARIKVV